MKDTDVIFDATYTGCCAGGIMVEMGTSLRIGGLKVSDADALKNIANAYGAELAYYGDIDAYDEYQALLKEYEQMEADGYDLTNIKKQISAVEETMANVSEEDAEYLLTNVDTLQTKVKMKETIEAQFESANVQISFVIPETTDVTLTSSEGKIDLMTAEPDVPVAPEPTNPEVPIATPVTTPDVPTYLRGDPDNDGKVTIDDAYNTLLYYANTSAGNNAAFIADGDVNAEQTAFTAADVDEDGTITITDAYFILHYCATESAGGEPSWDA